MLESNSSKDFDKLCLWPKKNNINWWWWHQNFATFELHWSWDSMTWKLGLIGLESRLSGSHFVLIFTRYTFNLQNFLKNARRVSIHQLMIFIHQLMIFNHQWWIAIVEIKKKTKTIAFYEISNVIWAWQKEKISLNFFTSINWSSIDVASINWPSIDVANFSLKNQFEVDYPTAKLRPPPQPAPSVPVTP